MNQEKAGKFIKELRVKNNLTQQELADKIGVTDRAISKWENGRGSPDISLLIPLSKELKVTVLELLSGERINDNDQVVINLIKKREKIIGRWKNIFLVLLNIVLLWMVLIVIYGYFIPKKYESSKTEHIVGVLSDSMSPTLRVGDQIIYDVININSVKENDFVVFQYKLDNTFSEITNEKLITVHRVVEVINENGNISLITRGDNNASNDKYYVTKENFIGKYSHKASAITSYFKRNFIDFPIWLLIFNLLGIIGIILIDISVIYKRFIH